MPKMIGLINDDKSIINKEFLEGELNNKVPITRKVNGQSLDKDIEITAEVETIPNDEIDRICDQILGDFVTQTQIDMLYNNLVNPILPVEGVEF